MRIYEIFGDKIADLKRFLALFDAVQRLFGFQLNPFDDQYFSFKKGLNVFSTTTDAYNNYPDRGQATLAAMKQATSDAKNIRVSKWRKVSTVVWQSSTECKPA